MNFKFPKSSLHEDEHTDIKTNNIEAAIMYVADWYYDQLNKICSRCGAINPEYQEDCIEGKEIEGAGTEPHNLIAHPANMTKEDLYQDLIKEYNISEDSLSLILISGKLMFNDEQESK